MSFMLKQSHNALQNVSTEMITTLIISGHNAIIGMKLDSIDISII